jgi:hypothetical protein
VFVRDVNFLAVCSCGVCVCVCVCVCARARACVGIVFISHVPLHVLSHVFLVNIAESEIDPSQPTTAFQKGTGGNVQSVNNSTKHSLPSTANKSSIYLTNSSHFVEANGRVLMFA